MPTRDGAAIRRERMMRILQLVKSNPGILLVKIQRQISWQTGLTPKTVSNYIQELVELGKLVQTETGFTAA